MKLCLAPLADFTDAPFRRLCFEGGADLCYTEMVSAAGLFYGSGPTRRMMDTMPGEGPVACQIFGADEREVAFAAREVDKLAGRFVELNLNAGCPMPRIMRTGAGAKLVEDPEKVHRLLKAMAENTSLPVTLKTRLGPHRSEPRIMELIDAAERAGATGLVVHARSTGQKHGGPLNLELLAEAVRRARVPVVGNGSVKTAADLAAMAATGVAGVMIGRAALANPGIFAELKGETSALAGLAPERLAERHLEHLLEFRRLQSEWHSDERIPDEDAVAVVKMRTHLFRYFNGRPGSAKLRGRLCEMHTLSDVRAALCMAK